MNYSFNFPSEKFLECLQCQLVCVLCMYVCVFTHPHSAAGQHDKHPLWQYACWTHSDVKWINCHSHIQHLTFPTPHLKSLVLMCWHDRASLCAEKWGGVLARFQLTGFYQSWVMCVCEMCYRPVCGCPVWGGSEGWCRKAERGVPCGRTGVPLGSPFCLECSARLQKNIKDEETYVVSTLVTLKLLT